MKEPNQKRANKLSAISFGIIVFIIAGGSFEDTGSFMGGAIEFDHSYLLKYAFLILFGYYLYKYWLLNRGPVSKFLGIITTRVRTKSKRYSDYIEKKGAEILKYKIENEETVLGTSWNKDYEGKPVRCKISNKAEAKPLLKYKKAIFYVKVELYAKTGLRVVSNNKKFISLEISVWKYIYYYIWESIRFITLDDRFSSEYYPYILSTIAILLLFYEYFISL